MAKSRYNLIKVCGVFEINTIMRGKGKAYPKLENLFAKLIFLADITTYCNKPYICLPESKTYSEI